MRHKTNWERVMAAIDSIRGNKEAVEILRRELGPKYARIVEQREKVRAAVYAYRATERGRRARQEYDKLYAKQYREANREKCNAASRECHRRKRERERAARIENETKQENQK